MRDVPALLVYLTNDAMTEADLTFSSLLPLFVWHEFDARKMPRGLFLRPLRFLLNFSFCAASLGDLRGLPFMTSAVGGWKGHPALRHGM